MNKRSLEEATIQALYDQLDDSERKQTVDGIVDDILVITDPEISSDEYNELIDRAQEIVEDTPEGDIPQLEDYLGKYVQMCPICGATFVKDTLLESGEECPICGDAPESFVFIGKLEPEEKVAEVEGVGETNEEESTEEQSDEEIEEPEVPEEPVEEESTETNEDVEEREPMEASEVTKTADNKLQENKLQEDRVDDLLKIVDKAFEPITEGKECDESEILEEAIRLTSIPNVRRATGDDFSDDGTRFYGYLYKDTVPISYTKADGEVYITVAFHHLDDINYDEYKNFPSYNPGFDEFNGVVESQFDPKRFEEILEMAYNDITNFRNTVEKPNEEEIEARIKVINDYCKQVKEEVESYIKENASKILNLSEYGFKNLKNYVSRCGTKTADYIRTASDARKRTFLSDDVDSLKSNISGAWQMKYIKQLLDEKNESAPVSQPSKSLKGFRDKIMSSKK